MSTLEDNKEQGQMDVNTSDGPSMPSTQKQVFLKNIVLCSSTKSEETLASIIYLLQLFLNAIYFGGLLSFESFRRKL